MHVIAGTYRVIFAAALFVLFGLGSAFLSVTLGLVLRLVIFNEKKRISASRKLTAVCFKFFLHTASVLEVIKVNFHNLDRLKEDKGVIIIANHPSLIDYVILASCVPNMSCVVKSSLKFNPLLTLIIKNNGYILNIVGGQDFLDETCALLNRQDNLLIFPEGTRTIDDDNIKFKHGFANLAVHGGFDIRIASIRFDGIALRKNKAFYKIYHKKLSYSVNISDKIYTKEFCQENKDLELNAVSRRLCSKVLNRLKEGLSSNR